MSVRAAVTVRARVHPHVGEGRPAVRAHEKFVPALAAPPQRHLTLTLRVGAGVLVRPECLALGARHLGRGRGGQLRRRAPVGAGADLRTTTDAHHDSFRPLRGLVVFLWITVSTRCRALAQRHAAVR